LDLGDGAAGDYSVAGCVLAEGFGPSAIAMGVVGFSGETEVAAAGDFFAETAEIGTEFVVANDAKSAIFEVTPDTEGEFFFYLRGEIYRFDFPTELFAGTFGKLHTQASSIDAGAFELA
jgi:hypothetical protein